MIIRIYCYILCLYNICNIKNHIQYNHNIFIDIYMYDICLHALFLSLNVIALSFQNKKIKRDPSSRLLCLINIKHAFPIKGPMDHVHHSLKQQFLGEKTISILRISYLSCSLEVKLFTCILFTA